jgi:hypothetical protein
MSNQPLLPPLPPSDRDIENNNVQNRLLNPDWSWLNPLSDREMISSAFKAVNDCEGWEILRNFDGESIIYSRNANIQRLCNKANDYYNGGHSGASMGVTMRNIEYIAKNGFQNFRNTWIMNEWRKENNEKNSIAMLP